MLIVIDTFPFPQEDYVVYVMPGEDVREKIYAYHGKDMQEAIKLVYRYTRDINFACRVLNGDFRRSEADIPYRASSPDDGIGLIAPIFESLDNETRNNILARMNQESESLVSKSFRWP